MWHGWLKYTNLPISMFITYGILEKIDEGYNLIPSCRLNTFSRREQQGWTKVEQLK